MSSETGERMTYRVVQSIPDPIPPACDVKRPACVCYCGGCFMQMPTRNEEMGKGGRGEREVLDKYKKVSPFAV